MGEPLVLMVALILKSEGVLAPFLYLSFHNRRGLVR